MAEDGAGGGVDPGDVQVDVIRTGRQRDRVWLNGTMSGYEFVLMVQPGLWQLVIARQPDIDMDEDEDPWFCERPLSGDLATRFPDDLELLKITALAAAVWETTAPADARGVVLQ